MYSIRQQSLFSLQDLLEICPKDTYSLIFETLDINPFLRVVSKKAISGAPTQLNYAAMLHSLFVRVVERIPTIKDLRKRLKTSIEFSTDCGFLGSDRIPSQASYKQVSTMGARALIDYNRRNEQPQEGKDKYFRPVCKEGHSYRYDSFDVKYETVKYTKPKECENCPFNDGTCQKVHKVKIESDPRKYTVPARGSDHYFEMYKKRTAVERVNAYLKEYFQLNNIRHRGSLANIDFQISCLTYTACKLTVDRLNQSHATKSVA